MISELLSSLCAPVFAAIVFLFILKSRSREINGGEATSNAAGNDGTAGGASSTHSSTGVPERASSSGANNDAAANDGTAGGASGAHTSTEARGMAPSPGHDFEVFLSFRGRDTRAGFADFLYTSLTDAGIGTFRDDESLRKGEEFAPELLQAIKHSKILVPIFSKDYAASVWCLKEVVQMVECRKTGRQKIMPIFYDVAPSEVRRQSGAYGDAFRSHEKKKRYDQKTIGEWKAALSAVGEINGWDLHNNGENRREGVFVKTFTHKVFNDLKMASLAVSDYLVGVDDPVDAVMEKIGDGTSETRIIGIHGMGGMGKTTIAKVIFNSLADSFENCCFLRDIRETSKTSGGIQCLQKELIYSILKKECEDIKDVHEGNRAIKKWLSNKRVLLLLDDVEEAKHIDAFVCKRDWLGEGSKVIITTRRIDVLSVPEVDDHYELKSMNSSSSLQLFSKHAFRRDSPLDEYINQSNRAIQIAGGLPLAIEVIASLLSCAKKEQWDARLSRLENVPPEKVQRKLRICYDALTDSEKHIFLDIACLFIGYKKDILVLFWEFDFYPEDAMIVLQSMSLIKITDDNKVWMHDQLRDLGKEMVREESKMKVEKQSRVWDPKRGLDFLRKHKGKKEVHALRLEWEHQSQCHFTYEGFDSLSNVRFFEVNHCREYFFAKEGEPLLHESLTDVLPTNGNSNLLPNLRWLSWSYFPLALNIANFFMEDVVILNLSQSEITYEWKGWNHMKVMKNLKVLNLSRCENLTSLPDELGRDLASLEYLSLNHCGSLERLPDSIGNLESLIELDISWTRIKELPDSIGKLKNLKRLNMDISKIPDALWTIEKLEEIKVSARFGNQKFHVNIGNCIYKNQSLRIVILRSTVIHAVPKLPESLVTLKLDSLYLDTFPDLSNLTNLKELLLWFRSRDSREESDGPLEEYLIPRWIGNLSKLESLRLDCPFVTTSPTDLTLPSQLKSLSLFYCLNLRRLPRLPSSLSSLHLDECKSLESIEDLDLSSPQLKELCIECCPKLRRLPRLPSSLSSLDLRHCESLCSMEGLDLSSPQLKELRIEYCPNLRRLPRLPSSLSSLRLEFCDSLRLSRCPNLRRLPRLPSSLSSLHLSACRSLCSMGDLSNLKNLSFLVIPSAAIEEIQGLGCLENLPKLTLRKLGQVKILPDLSNLKKLTILDVSSCPNLVEIQGELPQSLELLKISSCESLQKLPDLSSLKKLLSLMIQGCKELNGEAILSSAGRSRANLLENLHYLRIGDLERIEILPDLSNFKKLTNLDVSSCPNLVEIQGELPQSLEVLTIDSCESLRKLPDLSSLKNPRVVSIEGCKELKGEAILSSARRSQANLWENLQYLRICDLEQMEILPDLSNFKKLRCLNIQSCANLVAVEGEFPECLEELEISSCINIQELPNLSRLNGLREVKIYGCVGLNVEAISSLCSEKSIKFLGQPHFWEMSRDREDTESESEYDGEEEE